MNTTASIPRAYPAFRFLTCLLVTCLCASATAGVVYVNRPQGATTGAWPGYQPFGGWKASGSTGKAIGSHWYLPLYLREQSRTIVD